MRTLDVLDFPTWMVHPCEDGSVVDFADLLTNLRPTLDLMAVDGLIKQKDSIGFAVSRIYLEGEDISIDDFNKHPERHVHFVGGWGPEQDRFTANAVRKMAPLYRTLIDESTLAMMLDGQKFKKVVESAEPDGSFRWGEFPHGGAVWIQLGHLMFCVSVSALHPIEDHAVALLFGNLAAKSILVGDGKIAA